MKKVSSRINENVRRLCRDINKRVNDPERLQTLVVRLQELLREKRYDTRAAKVKTYSDNPFDKIMV